MSKVTRKQPARQAQIQAGTSSTAPDPEVLAKRTKRRLEDLERSNYTEPKLVSNPVLGTEEDAEEIGTGKHRARDTISLKSVGKSKKKSTQAVRNILLYRKTFSALLEEANLENTPAPNYLTAAARPPKHPPRSFCGVCGYFGSYRCQKCGVPYCTIPCQAIHDETGCERRLVA